MKIVIVGCGKIGSTILSSLVAEGHDVVGVDNNADVIKEITNIYDAMGVCGNGADCETLSEAGVEGAELFAAVTGSDEVNMLSCFIAKRMGAKHTIARIRNPEYNDSSLGFLCQQLDLSMAINPELLTAHELYHLLKLPSAAKVETFSRRKFEIIELHLKEGSKLAGMSLIDLRKKYDKNFLICAVLRDDNVYIPDGNTVLKEGDRIGITATPHEMHRLLRSLGLLGKQARDVMILGAGRTSFYLAKMLLAGGNDVKIVEIDPERSAEFAEKLPGAVLINGDGAQQELLLEEGIRSMDAFVSLTGMDEENILISYFASSQNVPKVISKVNRDEFRRTAEKLGLETIVSPRKIIADVLVRYARALKNSIDSSSVESLYKLMDGNAEAIEFIVGEDCDLVNIPLKDLKMKDNILIAGIVRGKKSIIPAGDDVILPGDNVVILTAGHRIETLSDIIK